MAKSPHNRRRQQLVAQFRRAAWQRLEEATFLLERGSYFTASVYLGGYAVECILKALILANDPPSVDPEVTVKESVAAGAKSHKTDYLKAQLQRRQVSIPSRVNTCLLQVNWWETDLRYSVKRLSRQSAMAFLDTTREIVQWANGRL
jgi:hypothetical protein